MLLSGCSVRSHRTPGPSATVAARLSDAWEAAVGELIAQAAWQQKGGVYPDGKLNAYVDRVGTRLARAGSSRGLSYRFKVINESVPDLFPLPGGFVGISRGLLVELKNEAQLAAVLGHAIAHIELRHALRNLPELDPAEFKAAAGQKDPGFGPLQRLPGEVAARLLDYVYSRSEERDADQRSMELMIEAGYDPWEMIRFQEYFRNEYEPQTQGGREKGLAKLHPLTGNRIAANRDYLQKHDLRLTPGKRPDFPQFMVRLKNLQPGYARYEQGRRLERNGRLSEAVAAYLEGAAAAPDETLILTGLGMAYLQLEQLNSARMHLSRAVRLDGHYYYSRMGLGYVYLRQGRFDQAITELQASMRLLPSPRGACLLAEAYEKSGDVAPALDRYREVVQADSRSKLGRYAAERIRALEEN